MFQRKPNEGDAGDKGGRVARLADPNEVDRAERNAAGWRAAFFVMSAILVLSFLAIGWLAATERTTAVVYYATPGEIKYLGSTAQVFTPTLLQTEDQIGTFITTVRHIPNQSDCSLADQDALTLEAMLDKLGYGEWTGNLQVENPKLLCAKGYQRDVPAPPMVTQDNALSYHVTWSERVWQPGQQQPLNINASATVTLGGQPQPPTALEVGQRNPVGIAIRSYDLKAPLLGQ